MKNCLSIALMLFVTIASQAQSASDFPTLPPIPEVDTPKAIGSVPLGDINTFREIQLDIPITEGPFKPSWESIEANYPGTPQDLRFTVGKSGDLYAFCMRSPEAGQKVTIKAMGKQQVKKNTPRDNARPAWKVEVEANH